VDLAAAGLTFWALSAYVEGQPLAAVVWFGLAALTKETAILAPMALAVWEIIGRVLRKGPLRRLWLEGDDRDISSRIASLLIPALPLGLWYAYHYARTGYVFGNPEFFRYNVAATLSFTRFLLALAMRLWQISGYLHLWVLTLAMLLAMSFLPPRCESAGERPRISIPVQMVFYVVLFTYVVAMALIGGAVLARYMLPAVPLVIILSVSTLWRRLHFWQVAVACVALAFVVAWFWNPPYGFSPEDNLAYRDYVVLHEDGERFLEARYPMARVLTAWPASDEITRPWLGYTTRPMRVVRIENFSLDEVLSAAALRSNYEVALIFSTKYEPGPAPWDHWRAWTELKTRFFGFHRDLPPAAAAQILGGRIVFSEQRQGQWIAVIEMERMEEAQAPPERSLLRARFRSLLPDGIQHCLVDGIHRAIAADQRRGIGFANAFRKLDPHRQFVGRQVPAVEVTVFAVCHYRLCEGINRRGIDAPFPNRSGKVWEIGIGSQTQFRDDFVHDLGGGNHRIVLSGVRVEDCDAIMAITGVDSRVVVVLRHDQIFRRPLIAGDQRCIDDRGSVVPAKAAGNLLG
jgi:hypothetical protein